MRGRKPFLPIQAITALFIIKKESPNEGTETYTTVLRILLSPLIKKESPNEGTETCPIQDNNCSFLLSIKKESPNEGTET